MGERRDRTKYRWTFTMEWEMGGPGNHLQRAQAMARAMRGVIARMWGLSPRTRSKSLHSKLERIDG